MRILPVLLLATTSATGYTHNGWLSTETEDTFAAWPDDMQEIVDAQVAQYDYESVVGADTGAELPVMRVFTSFPESNEKQRIWPLLHGMAKRMDPLFMPHATFYLLDGLSYGCRAVSNDGTVPVKSEHCHNHCIRQGRYCAPQKPDELPGNKYARDIVQEIYRRICFMHHYHAAGSSPQHDGKPTYYDYLQAFDKRDCLDHANFTECSFSVMEEVGAPAYNLDKCLEADLLDEDVASATLDKNLELLVYKNLEDLPQVEINEVSLLTDPEEDYSTETFFFRYCDAFGTNFKELPLACQVCEPCEDIQTCLWTLKCDGSFVSLTPPDETDDYYSVKEDPDRTPDAAHKDTNVVPPIQNTSSSNHTSVVFFLIVAISCLLAVALYMFLDFKARRRLAEDNDKTKVISMAGAYYDENRGDEAPAVDYSPGESVRRKKEAVAVEKDLVDLALDNMGGDVMGEESEWAENKRSSTGIV